MATQQRKIRRKGELLSRAQRAQELEAQLDAVRAQLNLANQTIFGDIAHLSALNTANRVLLEDNNTLRATITTTIASLEQSCDHIERLIKERDLACAARDVAERVVAVLQTADRDTKKLRRRLVEAKEKIEALQTEVHRLTNQLVVQRRF